MPFILSLKEPISVATANAEDKVANLLNIESYVMQDNGFISMILKSGLKAIIHKFNVLAIVEKGTS